MVLCSIELSSTRKWMDGILLTYNTKWIKNSSSISIAKAHLNMVPLTYNISIANNTRDKISFNWSWRGVATVLLASIHPVRNTVNIHWWNRCHALQFKFVSVTLHVSGTVFSIARSKTATLQSSHLFWICLKTHPAQGCARLVRRQDMW